MFTLQARYKFATVRNLTKANMNVWLKMTQVWRTHTEPIYMCEVRFIFIISTLIEHQFELNFNPVVGYENTGGIQAQSHTLIHGVYGLGIPPT